MWLTTIKSYYAHLTAHVQTLPGYPAWLLATQSYLLSEQGTTTDCLVGANSNGCETDCTRFVPPFNFFTPSYGGYLLVRHNPLTN